MAQHQWKALTEMTPGERAWLTERLVELYSLGHRTPKALVKALGVPEAEQKAALRTVFLLTQSREWVDATAPLRGDVVEQVIERIKRGAERWLENVEELADNAADERVRLAANRDLLDRAGTAAAMKVAAGTPGDWESLAAKYLEKPKGS